MWPGGHWPEGSRQVAGWPVGARHTAGWPLRVEEDAVQAYLQRSSWARPGSGARINLVHNVIPASAFVCLTMFSTKDSIQPNSDIFTRSLQHTIGL
jgi:hypothetical protein